MKKLRFYVCLIVIIVISFSFTSCNYVSGYRIAVDISEEIMRCFDERDAESLKTLFFANDLPTSNLDKQIKEAFEFYDGPSVSYDLPVDAGGGKSMDDGEMIEWHIAPVIENIETDGDITYLISCHMYIIYNGYETKKITRLTIFNQDDQEEKVTIGKYFY